MENILRTSVIVVAAGKGTRMNRDYNKQYILLEDTPILGHTLKVFNESSYIDEIVLVVGIGEVDFVNKNIVGKYGFTKVTKVIEGGAERQDSVYNGLINVNEYMDIIMVHDGARPFVTEEIIRDSIDCSYRHGACIVAVPVKDTIKVANGAKEVLETPSRDTLWSVQTPQTFKGEIILDAYKNLRNGNLKATDDSMVVESMGYRVKIIDGSYENIKITTPEDLILGEGILRSRGAK